MTCIPSVPILTYTSRVLRTGTEVFSRSPDTSRSRTCHWKSVALMMYNKASEREVGTARERRRGKIERCEKARQKESKESPSVRVLSHAHPQTRCPDTSRETESLLEHTYKERRGRYFRRLQSIHPCGDGEEVSFCCRLLARRVPACRVASSSFSSKADTLEGSVSPSHCRPP